MRQEHQMTSITNRRYPQSHNGVGTSPAPQAMALPAAMAPAVSPVERLKTRLRDPKALEHMLGLGLWALFALIVLINI